MTFRGVAAAALLLAAGPAFAQGRASEVAAWLTGTFEAKDPVAGGDFVRIVVVSIPKSRLANGAAILYREEASAPRLDEPSLQRFYRVEEDGEVVRLRAFDPKDPFIVRGKWRDPATLALYGPNDVRVKLGCTITLKRVGVRWEGGTPEATALMACPSAVRSAVRISSSMTLSKDELVQWDRGFDERGKQTWGSLEGGTTFVKKSPASPVDDSLQERTGGRREKKENSLLRKEEEKDGGKDEDSLKVREKEKEKKADSLKVEEPEAQAPPSLTVLSPSSPSRKYSLTELRSLAGADRLLVSRLLAGGELLATSVVVVTSRSGGVSVFSSAETSSSSSDRPSLDVTSSFIRLVAPGGRGLDDVVSIELRVLAPAPAK